MRYGFVIDQTRCIGCHACTVACKEENRVPLGTSRTWVKYVEKGEFPNTRRHFAVLRCNHCDNAPCVTICPTVALYRRADGIVDFDRDRCIGCKSCMQACPYDALYIDPETQTAAKCHYCAHRVEVGLEPACVIVCPVRAILAGDLDDPARGLRSNSETWFKPPEAMAELFAGYPEALASTLEIADKCNFVLADSGSQIPRFPIPEQFPCADDYLAHLVRERLPSVVGEVTAEIGERVEYELDVIRKMKFSEYFLIVWDIVNSAREMGIPVGPGRGSAAGSMVCYALGITAIDPISNGLLFERFLNPERISMPDIDIDFCDEKRQLVIDHVVEKYGKDFRSHACGSGPFKLLGWEEGQAMVLAKNERYYEKDSAGIPLPYIDGIKISFYDNKATEFLQFQQGQLDYVNDLDPSFISGSRAEHGPFEVCSFVAYGGRGCTFTQRGAFEYQFAGAYV